MKALCRKTTPSATTDSSSDDHPRAARARPEVPRVVGEALDPRGRPLERSVRRDTGRPAGHDFGRVSVLAPGTSPAAVNDQTPLQSGGLGEEFVDRKAPAPETELGATPARGFTPPVVDKVELVTSSAGAVGGFPGSSSCHLNLNNPEPYNDPSFTGSVANVHQVHFHVSQGRPDDMRAKRLVKRTSDQNGDVHSKPGNDGPSPDDGPPLHEYRFTQDKMVIADAPGFCWGRHGLDTSHFPMTYSGDFSLYAFDPLDKRILASISYRVEISKTHYSQGNPTNRATVTGVKLGAAVPSPAQPKK